MPFDFNTAEVRAVCDKFKLVESPSSWIPSAYLSLSSDAALKGAIDKTNPKTQFITTCHTLCYRMLYVIRGPQDGVIAFPEKNPLP